MRKLYFGTKSIFIPKRNNYYNPVNVLLRISYYDVYTRRVFETVMYTTTQSYLIRHSVFQWNFVNTHE